MTGRIPTRFLIISDTHNFRFDDAAQVHGAFRHPTPKADVLLHCGDLTMTGGLSSYRAVLKMLGSIEAEMKLVIAGNHDLSLDKEFWAKQFKGEPLDNYEVEDRAEHEKALEIMQGPLAREAGVTYLEEGLHSFTLKNGSKFSIYASPFQPEFCGWAFPYKRHMDRFNPAPHTKQGNTCIATNPIPDFPGVDIVMTHGPPQYILDRVIGGGKHVGCENLMRAVSRARPLMYCFGHIHEGHGAQVVEWVKDKNSIGSESIQGSDPVPNSYPQTCQPKWPVEFGRSTLMVNAAIMDVGYKATNAPWLVDLDLKQVDQ